MMKNGEVAMMLAPVLTPHGVLTVRPSRDVARLEPDLGARLEKAFAKGPGHGLLCLGADEVATVLPPVLSYWREFGVRYVTALCALPETSEGRDKPPVPTPVIGELEPAPQKKISLSCSCASSTSRGISGPSFTSRSNVRLQSHEYLESYRNRSLGQSHMRIAKIWMQARKRFWIFQPEREVPTGLKPLSAQVQPKPILTVQHCQL
jgi:hypothetical protein